MIEGQLSKISAPVDDGVEGVDAVGDVDGLDVGQKQVGGRVDFCQASA